MKRIHHPYWKWEDAKAGMWRTVIGKEAEEYLEKAIDFMGNADMYGYWMLQVIEQWPNACEHNLTCDSMNRQAWIGHAACCLSFGCPEEITRLAWHRLTDEQRGAANAKADIAIALWETRREEECQKNQLELMF